MCVRIIGLFNAIWNVESRVLCLGNGCIRCPMGVVSFINEYFCLMWIRIGKEMLTSEFRAQTGSFPIAYIFFNVHFSMIFFLQFDFTYSLWCSTASLTTQRCTQNLCYKYILFTLVTIPTLARRWWIWFLVVIMLWMVCGDSFLELILLIGLPFCFPLKINETKQSPNETMEKMLSLDFALWWSVVVHLSTGTHTRIARFFKPLNRTCKYVHSAVFVQLLL